MDGRKRLKMKNVLKNLFVITAMVVVAACGNQTQTPTTPTTNTPTTNTNNNGVPDLTGALPILLTNGAPNYTGLNDLAHGVYPTDNGSLVGNARVLMRLGPQRSTTVTGSIIIAFEDLAGFWAAQLSTFETISTVINNTIDAIFSDDEFVLRVTGSLVGNNIQNGRIYYRVRGYNENQCKKVVVTCYGYPSWWPCPQPDYNTPCRNYMSTTNTQVKSLGTFQGAALWN
jgi:hypothetical protein